MPERVVGLLLKKTIQPSRYLKMNLRFQACIAASRRQPVPVHQPAGRPAVYFGKYVFSDEKMRRYLPQKAYSALRLAIRENSSLGRDVADIVANGMKKWAMEMGGLHIAHTGSSL